LPGILKEEGYISNYKTQGRGRQAGAPRCISSTAATEAAIRDLARVSRPGCRVYIGRDRDQARPGGLGISIMTTPKGRHDGPPGAAAKA